MDPISINNHMRTLSGAGQLGKPEIELVPPSDITESSGAEPSFGQTFAESLQKVNDQMLTSDKMVNDLATGQSSNIHGTLISMQKADISFRMVLEVRNKVMRAYEEIMRMQV